ncbi:MAG: hypothetical protein WKF73_11035 [Nocardioidaceae bacterium]
MPDKGHARSHQARPAGPLLPDALDIVDELTARGVLLQLGSSVHDPTDPVGRWN